MANFLPVLICFYMYHRPENEFERFTRDRLDLKLLSRGGEAATISGRSPVGRYGNRFQEPFFSRHVRDSMCNGKFRAAVDDKFAAVHSNIFRVLGARGARDYLDRRAPEGDVPLPLHIHKSFVDRATNPYPTGHCLLVFSFLSCLFACLFKANFHTRASTNTEVYIHFNSCAFNYFFSCHRRVFCIVSFSCLFSFRLSAIADC